MPYNIFITEREVTSEVTCERARVKRMFRGEQRRVTRRQYTLIILFEMASEEIAKPTEARPSRPSAYDHLPVSGSSSPSFRLTS